MAALQWILRGHGYDLTLLHVADALNYTLEAARYHGTEADTIGAIKWLVDQHPAADHAVVALLRRRLDELMKR